MIDEQKDGQSIDVKKIADKQKAHITKYLFQKDVTAEEITQTIRDIVYNAVWIKLFAKARP